MSDTVAADKTHEEYREFVDSADVLQRKVKKLAALVKKHSGRVVVYTGAGISTGAGIPDFRSGLGSVTGMPPGKWCQNATQSQWTDAEKREIAARSRRTTSTLQAIPTPSHMALVALHRAGILRGLISQNCDGLHRRSGFDPEALAELHGNTNLEYCGWCGHEYLRDFRASTGRHTRGKELTRTLWPVHKKQAKKLINPRRGRHYTGRRCQVPGCDGYLFDSTIDFGDNLPEKHINRGYQLAEEAGLCIVLGSRCSVSPACDMPISVGESGRDLVVVNLQKTAADHHAKLRIGAKIDDVMVPLMQLLGIEIPEFQLTRRVRIAVQFPQSQSRSGGKEGELHVPVVGAKCGGRRPDTGRYLLNVCGVDADGLPVDLLWNVQARLLQQQQQQQQQQPKKSMPLHLEAGGAAAEQKADTLEEPDLSQQAGCGPDDTLMKGRAKLNQDARSKVLAPGDTARIVTFPWANFDRPGFADLEFESGRAVGKCYSVPIGCCDVVDSVRVVRPTEKEQPIEIIVDAASMHGAGLAHQVDVPAGARVKQLTLMFRAHYGEPPLDVPSRLLAPAPHGTATQAGTVFTLNYNVTNRQWTLGGVSAKDEELGNSDTSQATDE